MRKFGSRFVRQKLEIGTGPPVDLEQLRKACPFSEPEKRTSRLLHEVAATFAFRACPSRIVLDAATVERVAVAEPFGLSAEQAFRDMQRCLVAGAAYRKAGRALAISEHCAIRRSGQSLSWGVLWECAHASDQIKLSIMGRRRFRFTKLLLPLLGWKRIERSQRAGSGVGRHATGADEEAGK